LRADLEERIRNDFIHGDTVAVDSWLLSITEARLCALVSLLKDATPGKDAEANASGHGMNDS
jgi:hypothetical protein